MATLQPKAQIACKIANDTLTHKKCVKLVDFKLIGRIGSQQSYISECSLDVVIVLNILLKLDGMFYVVDLAAVMSEVNIALDFSSIKWYGHLTIYAAYVFLYLTGWLNVIETMKSVG